MSLEAFEVLRKASVSFLIGGGFGLAMYSGRWRNTKDIDLYVLPQDGEKATQALRAAGFNDYYEVLPYDRAWISRSYKPEGLVDVIWAFANLRTEVDDLWFQRAPETTIRGKNLRLIPPEEMLWSKLYVLQGDHSDWPDLVNLLYGMGEELDWPHLLKRVGEDRPLIFALLSVFSWISPERASAVAKVIEDTFAFPPAEIQKNVDEIRRARLLDSRDWFVGAQAVDKPLAI